MKKEDDIELEYILNSICWFNRVKYIYYNFYM